MTFSTRQSQWFQKRRRINITNEQKPRKCAGRMEDNIKNLVSNTANVKPHKCGVGKEDTFNKKYTMTPNMEENQHKGVEPRKSKGKQWKCVERMTFSTR
jgi:hypothetical protein